MNTFIKNLIIRNSKKKGFTLLEILLVIAAIGVLASIVIVAINPLRQLGRARDVSRQSNINQIQKALDQYNIANGGYPAGIEIGAYKEICEGTVTPLCTDLSVLVPDYISDIPRDPEGGSYAVGINPENNSISVYASKAIDTNTVGINLMDNPIVLTSGDRDASFDTGVFPGYMSNPGISLVQSDGKILIGGWGGLYKGERVKNLFRLNNDGTVDTNFDIGVGFYAPSHPLVVRTIAIQSDEKILVGGAFDSFNNEISNGIIRLNSDGSRDYSLDTGTGFLDTSSGSERANINSITIQSDGKIIVVGSFTSYQGVGVNRIVRLNSDGSIDTTFNIGTGFTGIGGVTDIMIQSDGKLIVRVGGTLTYQGTSVNTMLRLNSDGSRDTTFNIGTGIDNFGGVNISLIQNDGKIIVGGGFRTFNGTDAKGIVRLNSNGSRDTTFNIGTGFVDPNSYFGNAYIRTLNLQSDGKLLVGGQFTSYQGVLVNGIVRLNSDGSRDTSFNLGSGFRSSSSTSTPSVTNLVIQNDGKIIAQGYFNEVNKLGINGIVRLNSDGNIDKSFDLGNGFSDIVYATATQSDGKILVGGGFKSYKSESVHGIVRLNSDGSIDTSFNIGTGFEGSHSWVVVSSIVIQNDGKIIVGGNFTEFDGQIANGIIRLNNDGSRDNSFNIGMGFGGPNPGNGVLSINIQSDGKIIVGGSFTSYQGVGANRIIRLNSDGSRDLTFDMGTGFDNSVNTTAIQSDGKIIVGGYFLNYKGESTKLIRLNSDGSKDSTFNLDAGITGGGFLSIGLQADGKILVGGQFWGEVGYRRLVRLNNTGSRDESFNVGTGFTGWTNVSVNNILVQNDGKILVGGYFENYQDSPANSLIRLNSDGTRDESFNSGTGFTLDVWAGGIYSISLQNDGKIIIGSQFHKYKDYTSTYLVRLLP